MKKKYNFDYVFQGHILVNDRRIYVEMIRSPHAHITNQVVMIIPGGPGFGGTEACLTDASKIHQLARENELTLPHIVLFDPLGTGKSESAHDLSEYNVENYALLNLGLLEALRQRMALDNLQVHLMGGSFGGIMVWQMKRCMQNYEHLHLKQLITIVGANGAGMRDYAMGFLETHIDDAEKRAQLIAAQNKLFDGTIIDQADYIKNFVLVMAGLYSDNAAAILNTWQGQLINQFPVLFAKTLSKLNAIIEYFGYEIPELRFQSHILDHCSVPVLTTFFRNDFDGFNVLDVVNPEEDGDIPVTIFTAASDHVIDPDIAIALQKKLPQSSAVFIWNGRHMRENNVREFYVRQATSLLANGCLNVPLIESSSDVLATNTYTQSYVDLLQHMHATSLQPDAPRQSYALASSLLTGPMSSSSMQPCSSNDVVDLTADHQEIEASISNVMSSVSVDMTSEISALAP